MPEKLTIVIVILLIFSVWYYNSGQNSPNKEGLGYWAMPNTTLISACDKNKYRGCGLQKTKFSAGNFHSLPPRGSPASFMAAQASNTLEQRPGNVSAVDVYSLDKAPYAYEVRLLHRDVNCKHKLSMLFNYIAKTWLDNGESARANVKFSHELVDETNPYNLYGGYPKVIKIRRNGQVLEYTGATNYGSLSDWIMNESILF